METRTAENPANRQSPEQIEDLAFSSDNDFEVVDESPVNFLMPYELLKPAFKTVKIVAGVAVASALGYGLAKLVNYIAP